MKKILELIPFLLLAILIAFYLKNPNHLNLSASLIVISITSLCGYRLYAMEQEKPDYVAMFEKEFSEYKERRDREMIEVVRSQEAAINKINEQVKDLSASYGKITVGMGGRRMDNFEF